MMSKHPNDAGVVRAEAKRGGAWVHDKYSVSFFAPPLPPPPPKAFFIAPVVVVKMCVLTVGRWMMFSPMKRFGIENPFG